MKKLLLFGFALLAFAAQAQDFAPVDKSVMDIAYFPKDAHRAQLAKNVEEKEKLSPRLRVMYSRPMMNGRKIFGELVKYGEPWRLGANESTELILYTPVKIGEDVLSAGRYTLYCTPGQDEWTLHVNPNTDKWGVYGFDFSRDVAHVSGKVQKVDKAIEALSIVMYEAADRMVHLKVGWENSVVEFPIELL
ncbi:DUF2911 domain-containing protein [Marinilongibacter aquaticus]|uniref:DUF2911 domain-containing protein n=1 Tax=Marinilongibacter aquaticus TaxID=2975157 RepID=UPI0021BD3A55|nr:DUF2911 domain-containing protein [Marinilongibacter aquaticus]UBM59859.1 DUF2911 domain-containing protein [Marinilongibacter aquaticus]